MKKKEIYGILKMEMVVCLALLLIVIPALAQSTTKQEQPAKVLSDTKQGQPTKTLSDAEQGKMDGERAGKKSKQNSSWFYAGCCLGPIGPMIANATKPIGPDQDLLTGKPTAYIDAYIAAFREAAKEKNASLAMGGCAVFLIGFLGCSWWGLHYLFSFSD